MLNVSPSESTLSLITEDNSAEMLAIVREKARNAPLFLAIDTSNKKGMHHMVKIITFWDFTDDYLFCVSSTVTDARERTSKPLKA